MYVSIIGIDLFYSSIYLHLYVSKLSYVSMYFFIHRHTDTHTHSHTRTHTHTHAHTHTHTHTYTCKYLVTVRALQNYIISFERQHARSATLFVEKLQLPLIFDQIATCRQANLFVGHSMIFIGRIRPTQLPISTGNLATFWIAHSLRAHSNTWEHPMTIELSVQVHMYTWLMLLLFLRKK